MEAEPLAHLVLQLAEEHGLTLDPTSIRFDEAGLEYRVAFVTELEANDQWALRIPRRAPVRNALPLQQLVQ